MAKNKRKSLSQTIKSSPKTESPQILDDNEIDKRVNAVLETEETKLTALIPTSLMENLSIQKIKSRTSIKKLVARYIQEGLERDQK